MLLKNRSHKLIVSSDCIEMLTRAQDLNCGLKPHVLRKFFHSGVGNPADFSLPIQENFLEDQDWCYEGYILHSFGKLHMYNL